MKTSFVLLALPVIAVALASSHDASASEAPKFSELTPGRVTTVPTTKAPAFIAPRESVPGFIVASQKWTPDVPLMHRHVTIVGDPKIAAAMKTDEGGRDLEDTSGMCFTESHFSSLDPDTPRDDHFSEWEQSLSPEANVWPKSKDNPQAGINAIHSEKVVEQGTNVTLETVDAWVDPATRGARLISKASLPLKLVTTTAVGGVKVYAGRDDRADGKRFIQFVVMRPRDRKLQRAGSMWGVRQDGNSVHGNCTHLRVAIPTDAKGGESAVIIAPVILPSLQKDDGARDETSGKDKTEKSDGDKKAKDLPPAPPPPPPPGAIRSGGKRVTTAAPPGMQEKEIRIRAMQVQVSVSRTTKDKDPVLSVSFGWANRETTQRIFEAEDAP
jgi:hypothetical protein